jgi:peptidoglycan/LPS O-acetylase OafA/YrhL
MRASAISLVLLNHVALFFPANHAFFRIGLFAGYFGVELFFVLSGFLIGGILLRLLTNEKSTLSNFWLRRWFRTLPNYFLFLLVNIDIAFSLGGAMPSLWKYLFFAQNLTAPPQPFFVESWSLAVEEWFYLVTPVLFFIAAKLAPRKFRFSSLFVVVGSIVIVTIARAIFVETTNTTWLTGVRMIVAYRLDACMFGVFAAWLKHFHPEMFQWRPGLFFAIGVALLGFVFAFPFALPAGSLFLHNAGFILTSLGAVMLLPMFDRWRWARGRAAKVVVHISLWSYSLYLVNLPVRAVLEHFARNVSPLIVAPAYLFISIFTAALIFKFYEKPFMNLRERFHAHRGARLRLNEGAPLMVRN